MDTSGFYKTTEDNQLLYGPNGVSSLDYDLLRERKDEFTYPVGGWYWFNSEEEARIFFNLPLPSEETPVE